MQGFFFYPEISFFFFFFFPCMICRQYLDTGQARERRTSVRSFRTHVIACQYSGAPASHARPSSLPILPRFLFRKLRFLCDAVATTRSLLQDLVLTLFFLFCFIILLLFFFLYCLRRFCEMIIRNGYQWFSRNILNVT